MSVSTTVPGNGLVIWYPFICHCYVHEYTIWSEFVNSLQPRYLSVYDKHWYIISLYYQKRYIFLEKKALVRIKEVKICSERQGNSMPPNVELKLKYHSSHISAALFCESRDAQEKYGLPYPISATQPVWVMQ